MIKKFSLQILQFTVKTKITVEVTSWLPLGTKIYNELFTIYPEILSVKIGTHSPLVLCIVKAVCMPPVSALDQYDNLFNYLAENSII